MNIEDMILYENEHTGLDFKSKQYEKKEEFLKDLIAMANAEFEGQRYIIMGLKVLPGGQREFLPINILEFKDDAEYQQIVRANIEPSLKFIYKPIEVNNNLLGYFEIDPIEDPPYSMKKDFQPLKAGDSFIRKGSQQERMNRSDLEKIYSYRYKKKKEREVRESYIHLFKHELKNNSGILWKITTYVTEKAPRIDQLWDPANELSHTVEFEAWKVLLSSGVIGSFDIEELNSFRDAVKKTRDAIRDVKMHAANWRRLLYWHQNKEKLSQMTSLEQSLIDSSSEVKTSIRIARESSEVAIKLLEQRYNV